MGPCASCSPASLLAVTATTATAQTALQLQWQLKEDVFQGGGEGASRAAFTLTNRDRSRSPGRVGDLLQRAARAAARGVWGRVRIERVTGDLQRLVPGPAFGGLAPGQSVEIEYLTGLLTNNSFAPAGAYVVFDDAKDHGHALRTSWPSPSSDRRRARGATRASCRPSSSTRSTP